MTLKNDNEYWSRFWSEYTIDLADADEQSQVLRTRNKVPIDREKWEFTLESVGQQLALSDDDVLLDLCCGNGLFTSAFAPKIDRVEAVDLNALLIDRLNARNLPNVHAEAKDMRAASFDDQTFSKVLWYAGIQYIDEGDIVDMMRKIRGWMKPGGILMIGDIPDRRKLWGYFNDPSRQAAYFDGLAKRQAIIGTWLDHEWLENLCASAGFQEASAVPQDPKLIYADFRFDLIARTGQA